MSIKEKERNGIKKKIDNMGRITIPKAWRQYCGITNGTELNVFMLDDDTIALKVNRSTL